VHSSWVQKGGLAAIVKALGEAGITVHVGEGEAVKQLLPDAPAAPAPRHEYSSLDCTIEVVSDMEEAIDHIHA
jgi:delta-1-pyrroline-5-carboxylate synthetase